MGTMDYITKTFSCLIEIQFVYLGMKEKKDMTLQMSQHPGMVEQVIRLLKHINVDGETMEHILEEVGMTEQMLRQLTNKGDQI